MLIRRRTARPLSWLAVLTIAAGTAACGSRSSPAGPLRMQTAGGQPVFATASIFVGPGQIADTEAFLDNEGQAPVRIVAVSAVPAHGLAAASLVDAGLATSSGHGIASALDWPPPVPSVPAVGASLPHGDSGLLFGISGPAANHNYAVAGLKITYTYQGQHYSMVVWEGAAACVGVNSNSTSNDRNCSAFSSSLNTIVEKQAG